MAEINSFSDTVNDDDQLNEGYFQGLKASVVPIGGIIAWNKSFTGVPSLPAGFLECDGSVISDADSPLDGETLPDLNGDNRFLRGNSTSTDTGGSDTHNHSIEAPGTNTTGGGNPLTVSTESNVPAYYHVVWIMKIKNV